MAESEAFQQIKIRSEDINFITEEFLIDRNDAERELKMGKGDLNLAMRGIMSGCKQLHG